MADRSISIDLLAVTIGIKYEAGISESQVHALIDAFAADQRGDAGDADIVEFLGVKDIPAERREEFLAALSALAPAAPLRNRADQRMLSAVDIWPSRIEG